MSKPTAEQVARRAQLQTAFDAARVAKDFDGARAAWTALDSYVAANFGRVVAPDYGCSAAARRQGRLQNRR